MKKSLLLSALVLIIVWISIPSCRFKGSGASDAPEPVNDTVYPLGFCTDSFEVVEGKLKNGEIFSGLMTRLGLTPSQTYALKVATDSVFDVRKLRAGNSWQAYYEPDTAGVGKLSYLVYDMDRVSMTVFKCDEPYATAYRDSGRHICMDRGFLRSQERRPLQGHL